jgi:hypothetical protein
MSIMPIMPIMSGDRSVAPADPHLFEHDLVEHFQAGAARAPAPGVTGRAPWCGSGCQTHFSVPKLRLYGHF